MENIPELYILGNPIDTRIGKLYPVKIKDYYEFLKHQYTLLFEIDDLVKIFKMICQQDSSYNFFVNYLKSSNLFDFLCLFKQDEPREIKWMYEFYIKFKELFQFCFKEDVFDLIQSNEEFEEYRELIKNVNYIKVEKPNPNPEIERRNKLKRLLEQNRNDNITFEAMFTSIEAITGRDPNEMTIYRFHKLFERICQIKNYDTSTLFATISSEAKIEPWYKDIAISAKNENYITEEQLRKAKLNKKLQQDL